MNFQLYYGYLSELKSEDLIPELRTWLSCLLSISLSLSLSCALTSERKTKCKNGDIYKLLSVHLC